MWYTNIDLSIHLWAIVWVLRAPPPMMTYGHRQQTNVMRVKKKRVPACPLHSLKRWMMRTKRTKVTTNNETESKQQIGVSVYLCLWVSVVWPASRLRLFPCTIIIHTHTRAQADIHRKLFSGDSVCISVFCVCVCLFAHSAHSSGCCKNTTERPRVLALRWIAVRSGKQRSRHHRSPHAHTAV